MQNILRDDENVFLSSIYTDSLRGGTAFAQFASLFPSYLAVSVKHVVVFFTDGQLYLSVLAL